MNGLGTRTAMLFATLVLGLAAAGCGEDGNVSVNPQNPQHVAVLYLLVAFDSSTTDTTVTRTQAQAESLANSLYVRALAGEDFGDLSATYSDSPNQDTVRAANYGVLPGPGEYPRTSLVRGFGDVAFGIVPDSVGLAVYNATTCPNGWFLINRLE
jgi:hypothetical protein